MSVLVAIAISEKKPMDRFRKFLQLPWPDQLLVVRSTLALTLVMVGLKFLPWLSLQRMMLKIANWFSRSGSTNRPSAQQIGWAIRVASWIVPGATCLPTALVAQLLLKHYSYPVDFKFGVAKDKDGKLEAHAWVTTENRFIIGNVSNLDHYKTLSSVDRKGLEDYGKVL